MKKLLIGPYTDGEIPDPLYIQMEQTEEDYTGYTLTVRVDNLDSGSEVAFSGVVGWGDSSRGIVQVQFAAGDLAAPDSKTEYLMQVWAVQAAPARKIATLKIRYFVDTAVGSGAP